MITRDPATEAASHEKLLETTDSLFFTIDDMSVGDMLIQTPHPDPVSLALAVGSEVIQVIS